MIVLGIGDSHEAHACLLRDGEILSVLAEERLSRVKTDMGYPARAIDRIIADAGIDPLDIDAVAVAGRSGNPFQKMYKMNAIFRVKDWIDQCYKIWKPALLDGQPYSPIEDYDLYSHLRPNVADDPYYPIGETLRETPRENWPDVWRRMQAGLISRHLGIAAERVHHYRHEDCHKAYGFYSSPDRMPESLVFTLEGGGDDSSATVSTVSASGVTEHWRSNEVMLGRLYRYVTLILGMLPTQHEYKVMGLAPYGTEYHGRRSLEFFRTINRVVGTEIVNRPGVPDMYFSVKEALEGERFDGIAWGLQAYLEEVLCAWVQNNVRAYEQPNVILSGGVAQNVKACKTLVELDDVDSLWAGPVAGDGSLGVGAAWLALRELAPDLPIDGLPSVYLGTSYTDDDVARAIRRHRLDERFHVAARPDADTVAGWLEGGLIVARFSGRMEFGQRALGNRSILADPRKFESVERINRKIKYRDFWMPFTPSMMIEEAERMLVNPTGLRSPFMTVAFDLKPEFHSLIPAAIHPADKTVRPQMLRRSDNPAYYDLIAAFKARTGLGVLLNTSFNLHGDAIVESVDDAIGTFLKSDLDVLLFDSMAIARHEI